MTLMRTLVAALALTLATGWSATAEAQQQQQVKIGVVDFQRALNTVKEGAAAKQKLEGMFKEKKAAIDAMEVKLGAMQADYEKQAIILSDQARKQKEMELMQAQQVYQQTYMQSEQEMQAAYGKIMEDLLEKMRKIAEQIAKEQGYNLVLEVTEGGVVYNAGAMDITNELIKRYDAQPAK
jgi:outer membrane protein